MRAEQPAHLKNLTAREFETATPMQTNYYVTEQSGSYDAGTDHSRMDFADDAAATAPGWEVRPAAEFAHFNDPVRLRSRSSKWLREILNHFLMSVASVNLRFLWIAGAICISFVLGWTGGSSSVSGPNPNATLRIEKTDADIRHTGSIANATGPIATITESNTKLSATAASRHKNAGAAQMRARPQKTVPQHARESKSPVASLLPRLDSNPSLRQSPAPETKPTTIEGWSVDNVNGDRAVLVGPDRVWTVKRGDFVPGLGQIASIVRWGNRWIVATSSGLISTE